MIACVDRPAVDDGLALLAAVVGVEEEHQGDGDEGGSARSEDVITEGKSVLVHLPLHLIMFIAL